MPGPHTIPHAGKRPEDAHALLREAVQVASSLLRTQEGGGARGSQAIILPSALLFLSAACAGKVPAHRVHGWRVTHTYVVHIVLCLHTVVHGWPVTHACITSCMSSHAQV